MARTSRQDPPFRRSRTQDIGSEARVIARAAFQRAGFVDESLVLHWRDIVGPDIARLARPIRLTEKSGGGTLTLSAEPAASVFLQHEARSLCERINAFVGRPAVQRLRFVPGSLTADSRARPLTRASAAQAAPDDPARRFEGPDALKDALLLLAARRRKVKQSRID